ncbi:hypothetical protein EIP86_011600 [Pleurotus ostreatoroseus]|nr:hypothetical protein EIP86_011600 [Pleurotus ostreatoroseus]
MARNQHAGPSTLRNRNRVTNKTRLKIIKESIDADPIVLDEDEEKARVVSTAGVDAEDANEHHLQAVLSAAAANRHLAASRATRGAEKEAAPAAYIPTPDSTGVVADYEEFYPAGRWKDPHEYLKSSDTTEESVSFALANGFIYYMDDRDKEWLDKNNEEARGEGTSAQGAVSGTTRSGRSTKVKGKDPEVSQPAVMKEDEFELVMAIFEKVTHEKTEFLHHGLEQGSPFPPFSDYQDTFANALPPTMFALYTVPSWIPEATQMLRFAKVVYPYWRERRMERGGHPIIPVVNLDETDTKNESYICFRRRESKAIRKTRAQQATYSDKMIRLQGELAVAMDLANRVLQRETTKRDQAAQTKALWERRFALVDLKRKFPALGSREDEELFQDRERVPKRIKTDFSSGRLPLKLRTPRETEFGSPIIEPMMKPKDRYAQIQAAIDQELAKRKQEDHGWEDLIDNPYQPSPAAYASRCFKFYPASQPPPALSSDDEDERLTFRACRARFGRGGRMHVDRRIPGGRRLPSLPVCVSDDENSDEDRQRRLEEQWRFDDDDGPAFGPAGQEEQDRKLVDDFSQSYLVRRCSLMNEPDLQHLFKDTSVPLPTPDGRVQNYVTYRLGVQPVPRNIPLVPRANPSPLTPGIASMRHPNGSLSISSSSSGVGQAKMPPGGMQQVRISSANGVIRPPGTPVVPALPTQASPPRNASPAVNGNGHDGVNGEQDVKMANGTVPHAPSPSQPDGAHVQSDGSTPTIPISSPMRPKMTAIPNGFTVPSVQNYNSHIATGVYPHAGVRGNGMVKSALASLQADGTFQGNGHVALGRANTNYANAAFSQQLIAARQMQWATIPQGNQRPATALVDANMNGGVETTLAANLGMNVSLPARAPSTNGQRQAGLARGVQSPALAQAIATQGQGRVSPANVARLSHPTHMLSPGMAGAQPHQSPPRAGQAPMASPSLQSQVVGSSGTGY